MRARCIELPIGPELLQELSQAQMSKLAGRYRKVLQWSSGDNHLGLSVVNFTTLGCQLPQFATASECQRHLMNVLHPYITPVVHEGQLPVRHRAPRHLPWQTIAIQLSIL